MSKRVLIGFLWFLAAAYAGSVLHAIVGLSELVGPAIGLAAATGIIARARPAAYALAASAVRPALVREATSELH